MEFTPPPNYLSVMQSRIPPRTAASLGALVRSRRQQLALKQLDLAGLGNTGNRFIVDVENGKPTVQLQKVLDLMHLLGLEVIVRVRGARISLAGAQDQTSIALFADGAPRLPRGTAPSTHILKPDIRRLNKVWHSAVNETIVMLAAARCGLPTADVFYEPHTRACLVRRFDRFMQPEGRLGGQLGRLIQYDMCQLAGIVSEKKYEKEGGPGIAACAELIRVHSSQPAADLRHYVMWILFNLFTGNNDSHAKNLSLLDSPGKGMTLAPFYDLMCTRLYPGLSAEFAFSIGGESRPGHLTRAHLDAMSANLRMRPQFVAKLAAELAGKLPDAIAHAAATVRPLLTPAGKALAGRLTAFIVSTTAKTTRRLKLPVSPAATRALP